MCCHGITPSGWRAVCSLADHVVVGERSVDNNRELRRNLTNQGYAMPVIDEAIEWLEQASISGHLNDILGMLQSSNGKFRIENPVERVFVSDQLWNMIEDCRRRGIISDDAVERILSGARSLDTRDWDDEEVGELIIDILAGSSTDGLEKRFELAMLGKISEIYN